MIVVGGDAGIGKGGVLDIMDSTTISKIFRENSREDSLPLTPSDFSLNWKFSDFKLDTPRAGHAAVLVEERFLILIGGYNNFFHPMSSVEVWDLRKLVQSQESPNLYEKKEIFCHGPSLKYERQHVAACALDGNRIVVIGGQNALWQWHETIEMISFNPNAQSVHEVFQAPQETSMVADVAAGSPGPLQQRVNYDQWIVRDERISITHCTGIHSLFREYGSSFLALGRDKCQMITLMGNANESSDIHQTSSSRHIRFTKELKDSREFYVGAVVRDASSSGGDGMKLMLLGGKTANTKAPGLDYLPLPKVPHGSSPPPSPSLPLEPRINSPESAYKGWEEECRFARDNYMRRINDWRRSMTESRNSEIAWRKERIGQLLKEIDELEERHQQAISASDIQLDNWMSNYNTEMDKVATIMSTIIHGHQRRPFPPPVAPPHTEDEDAGPPPPTATHHHHVQEEDGEPLQAPASRIQDDGPPGHLRCPISHLLMRDPVHADDGYTYERAQILQWWQNQVAFRRPLTSPLTNERVTRRLIPNYNIKSQCLEWAEREREDEEDHENEQQPGEQQANAEAGPPSTITIDDDGDNDIGSVMDEALSLLNQGVEGPDDPLN